MAGDYTKRVKRTVEVDEDVSYNLWCLSLEEGDADSPFRVIAILRAKDGETGKWRSDVPDIRVEFVDNPDSPDPMEQQKGSIFYNLVLDCEVPANHPIGQMLGVAGQPLRVAGRSIIG